MRKIIAGLFVLVIAIAACKDNSTTLVPQTSSSDDDFSFKINGIKDTSLERTDYISYLIFVEKLTGAGEFVSLTIDSLPKGMDISFVPVSADTASFNTTMRIETDRVVEGTYNLVLKAATATAGVKSSFFNVKVLPYSNHAVGLVGNYTEKGACQQAGSVEHDVTIETAAEKNKVIIKGLLSGVNSNKITAIVNPSNSTIDIPEQVVNSVTYKGDGTFDDNKVVINYTVKGGVSVNESCSSTLTRK